MGKYLEIAQKALKEMPEDCCITEDQLLTTDLVDSAETSHCEKRELSEISPGELKILAGDDWDEISNDPAQLEAMKHMVRTAKQIEAGQLPDHYTSTTTCKHCGPVPIWNGCPPEVLGCPWCFNRIKGLQIPKVNNNE